MRLDPTIIDNIAPSGSLIDDRKKYQQEFITRSRQNVVNTTQKIIKGRSKIFNSPYNQDQGINSKMEIHRKKIA